MKGSQPLFDNWRRKVAWSQNKTTRALNERNTNPGTKLLPENMVFSINILKKLNRKIFRSKPRSHGYSKEKKSYKDTHTWGIFQVKSRSNLSRRAETIGKKLFHFQRVPWPHHLSTTERTLKQPQLLFYALQWISLSHVHFYFLCNWIKSVQKSRLLLKKPIFWNLSAIDP